MLSGVHLRAVKLRGFKSFPDPVEIRLEPGVAVVVGPNGSGKSNIADALVWAAGSLSPSELRAEKPDDVVFAGSATRPHASFCEVELVFDNEDGRLSELPFAEVSIVRRLHRGGEGQYLVNRTPVRRLDLVELLADVGLGAGMGSIIGQGRVEEILASRPQERRALVEDAAGLGRFKRRRHRAELKLARVQAQAERARDVEAEVAKRLRPLALQATAAERAERLAGELAAIEARLALLDTAALEDRLAQAGRRRAEAAGERAHAQSRLEGLLAERDRAEEELADAAGRREAVTAALYRLRSARERLQLRIESAEAERARLRADVAAAQPLRPDAGPAPEELERLADEAQAAARTAASERDALGERAALARERLAALERALAEREGLPPAARALADAGERLALSLLEVDSGYERAVAAALAWRGAAVLAEAPARALELVERTRAGGLGTLAVLVPGPRPLDGDPQSPVPGAERLAARVRARPGGEPVAALFADAWVVSPADVLRAERGLVVTREGLAYDPVRGELRFAGETAEAVLLELEARRRALEAEAEELGVRAEAAATAARDAEAAARAATARLAALPPGRRRGRADAARLSGLASLAERVAAALMWAAETAERWEGPLQEEVDAGSARAGELAAELRRLAAAEAELRRAHSEAGERVAAAEVELARLEGEAAAARRRFEEAGAEPADGDDRDALLARLERLERRREALGRVNPLAREEYEREKERLVELSEQRADLERSLGELEALRAELTETVERRFAETFAAVREHFADVAATLFPGGEGRLALTASEEEGEDAGIEVELRPAGKRITRLSLLSGGEKALGAIAFLFALFLARPTPFYLLDEVEAALDDANIGRFVALLRRYSERAQFIVVTHQKRTMEAADILYGVTMAADGVSQVVSRRLPREQAALASA